jgi:hypothetical protein
LLHIYNIEEETNSVYNFIEFIFIKDLLYQLDFVTPGSRQACDISLNTCLERPKSL